jgi:hypothetical protein
MQPTDELVKELRELLDEVIPEGGTEGDTRFADLQLGRMLSKANNIFAAAAEGWTRKAAMLQRELGKIEQYGVGSENYKIVNLTTAINAALSMAKTYREMAGSSMGSVILKFKPPEVL